MKKYLFLVAFLFSIVNGAIPVLVYHSIIKNDEEIISKFDISERNFELHMEALKKAGYQTLTLQDLLAFLKREKTLPEKPFLITFDDGRKDNLLIDSILERLGFTAIMFTITDPEQMKLPQRLKWKELNQMFQSKRWDIQAHGHFYHNLIPINAEGDQGNFASNKKWLSEKNRLENDLEYQQRLLEDLKMNKKEIEKNVKGSQVIAFAFPFGDYGLDGNNLSASIGIPVNIQNVGQQFPLAFILCPIFSQTNGEDCMVHKGTNPLLIPRFMDTGYLTGEEVVHIFDQASKL